ncbi:MAG: hypothetical protein KAQ71_13715 [Desulfobulbaceae bacterium]|nr:hypothetical protein [Desulfobulbaceae bacterium]
MVTAIIWFEYMEGKVVLLGEVGVKRRGVRRFFWDNLLESHCYFVLPVLAKVLFLLKDSPMSKDTRGNFFLPE